MAPINRNSISLYEDAKATFISLLQQTAQVGAGLMVMLLLTGGNPPGFIMGLSFCLGVGFVAWSENKRLEALYDGNLLNEAIIKSSSEIRLNELLPKNLSDNKRAILKTKINLISYPTTHFKLKKLIQKVILAKTDDFLKLAKIVGLEISKDFVHSDLIGANLSSAYLEGANLRDANLRDANLWSANLEGANLRDVNLEDANLEGANLKDAILVNAILVRANLEGADLKDAKVVEARFGYNEGLSDEMIKDLIERGAIFIDLQDEYSTVKMKR